MKTDILIVIKKLKERLQKELKNHDEWAIRWTKKQIKLYESQLRR